MLDNSVPADPIRNLFIYLFIYLSISYLFIYLSAILTAGTVMMIQTYYDPIYYNIQEIQYYNPVVNFKFEKGKQCERFHYVFISPDFSVSG